MTAVQTERWGAAGTGGNAERPAPPRLKELVAQAAMRLDRRQPKIAHDMSDLIAREIRSLDVDQAFLDLLRASVDANTKTITHILINDIPIERLQPTTAAVEYALRLAQRDIPANSLVRAYNVGKDDFIEQIFPDVQALECSAEEKFAVLQHMSSVVGRYIDWISQYVFEVYEEERNRWVGTQGNVRATLVHDVLSRRNVPVREFEQETGYRLDGHHIGLIIWSVDPAPAPDELRMLTQVVWKVAAVAGCTASPLITAVDRMTAWAWLPFAAKPPPVDMEQIRHVVGQARTSRLCLGLADAGVPGFRRTHEQARAARRVAISPADGTAAISFGDEGVAIASLLANDLESTSAWVVEVLGGLAVDAENMDVLRETLRVFLSTGESYTDTAALMNLHRNTVRYRVSKALEQVSTAIRTNRVDLAVALNVCRFLGANVLTPAGRK
ncbi:PucR family transcriptional regulator [Blastococcus sp. SYSU DS0973]